MTYDADSFAIGYFTGVLVLAVCFAIAGTIINRKGKR